MEKDDFNPNQLININDDKNNNKNFFKKFFLIQIKTRQILLIF